MNQAKYIISFILLAQMLHMVSSQELKFEIKRQGGHNNLDIQKRKWDIHHQHKNQQNQQTQTSSSSTSNFQNKQISQNEEKSQFKSTLLSNLRLNSNQNKTEKPVHGNYTSFSLYTTYGNAYLVSIYIGSERQEFQVLLDTGSSYTWLTHKNCTTCSELGINKYFDCEKSTTCANQHEEIELNYGRGKAMAVVYRDKIGFQHNKFIANNQDFLLVKILEDLDFFPGHGLFGLGFASLSDGRKTILDNLKEQGEISKRQFAFSLSGEAENVEYGMTNKDFFILGGDAIDPNLVDENESFTCPVSTKPYWSVDVQGIIPIISDVEINLHFTANQAIVDSGTSFIVFNSHDFEVLVKFFKKLQKLNCDIDEKYNLLKCNALNHSVYPIFKFTLCEQSRHILVYPQQYLICDETNCYIRIAGMNIGMTMSSFIILGDIFMRTQYTIFNQDDMTISFYQKKNGRTDSEPPQLLNDSLSTSLQLDNFTQINEDKIKQSQKKSHPASNKTQNKKNKKLNTHSSP